MMKLKNNTILITGGSSGLGLELAKQLLNRNNKVLICGRSKAKLQQAKKALPHLHIFPCDLSEPSERKKLFQWVQDHHPDCNILINNAAIVHRTHFFQDPDMIEKADLEIRTNFTAPVTLTKLFLPILSQNKGSSILNITTGLVYIPKATYPIYNATKAALHAFTQVLRRQLKDTSIQVIEVLMPVVDTPWHQGKVPEIAISPGEAITEMIRKWEKDQVEIKVGKVKLLYFLSRLAPGLASRIINKT